MALHCIEHKIHYIDLADARDYVRNFSSLNQQAIDAGVIAITGASTVPSLSSAVLENYKHEFKHIDSLTYGITPGQKTPRGLATTEAILSYLGKPTKSQANKNKRQYGWQDTYRQRYPGLGKCWMGNCDIPDLDLFPNYYHINNIRFSAGMESSVLHLGIWAISWLIRLGLPINLLKYSRFLLKASHLCDMFGSQNGGIHMLINGLDKHNKQLNIEWFIVVKDDDGPQVPAIPAIVLNKENIIS